MVTFEIPGENCFPPVNDAVPGKFFVQQGENRVSTNIADENCPIGSPGKLVIGIHITQPMLQTSKMVITGTISGVNADGENVNNYFYLISTNEYNQLITVMEITYPDMIADSGRFEHTLNSENYLLEQLGVGDTVGLYVVKSPYWGSADEAPCHCENARITLSSEEPNSSSSESSNMQNPLTTREFSDEEKWSMFVQRTEDVIQLLQTTFRTSERRARFAVGSIFSDNISDDALQRMFAMDRDDIYDAAIDWLFTAGLDLATSDSSTDTPRVMTQQERVLSFNSIASSVSREPLPVETPDTKPETQNLPQPVTKRVQSSFDKYCCICFMEYDDRVMTHCHHFFCRGCIMDYIAATDNETACECPMCRRPVNAQHLVTVPFGVAPTAALKSAVEPKCAIDRGGEIFVTFRSNRRLSVLMEFGAPLQNPSFDWYQSYISRPSKSYLSLRVSRDAMNGATGVRVSCLAKDQGFELLAAPRNAVLLGRYNTNLELCGVALIGMVGNEWTESNIDLPLADENNQWLRGAQEGDSFDVLLVASNVIHSKCYCTRAS